MTKVDKKLRQIIIEKYIFYIVSLLLTFLTIDSFFRFDFDHWKGHTFLISCLLILNTMCIIIWSTSDLSYNQLYGHYKIALSVNFLKQRFNGKINVNQCVQIIKNVNQELDFNFIPLLKKHQHSNYLPALESIVQLHFNENYISDYEQKVIKEYLKNSEDFLMNNEKDLLVKKSEFYGI